MDRATFLAASLALTVLLAGGVAVAQASDTTPPETSISPHSRPSEYDHNVNDPHFGFSSSEPDSTFECSLDGGIFEACSSPWQHEGSYLSEDRHTFAVRATDAAGNVDETPAEYAWVIDDTYPKLAWTEEPGRPVGDGTTKVTNDRTPTWAWAVEDENPGQNHCGGSTECTSPVTTSKPLSDGWHYFAVYHYDKAGNEDRIYSDVEVDTVAPKLVSTKPNGEKVSPRAHILVMFNDFIGWDSMQFVNLYRRGSSKPLPVYRNDYDYSGVKMSPQKSLKRDTWYTVRVTTGVNDGANNLAKPRSWSFRTR